MNTQKNAASKSVNFTIDITQNAMKRHIEFLKGAIKKSKNNVNKYIEEGLPDMSRSCERITNGLLIALENAEHELCVCEMEEKGIMYQFRGVADPDLFTSKPPTMDPNVKTEEQPAAGQPKEQLGKTSDQPNASGGDATAEAAAPDEKPQE